MIYWLLALVLVSASAMAAPVTLVDVDMNKPARGINEVDAATSKKIVGELPEGISDNSGWQEKIDLGYELGRDGERSFLRVSARRGNAQLQVALPQAALEGGYYRLKMVARSRDLSSINVSLRQNGPPYTNLFVTEPTLREGWGESEWSVRLPKQNQPFSIFLIASEPASVEIARVTLIRETREDLMAAAKARFPQGGERRNLVNVSRFPLGAQSGWGLDRDWSDELFTVAADESMIGPSGSPALRLVSPKGKPMNVSPAPFDVPWAFQKHTVSLAVRGEGTLVLRIFSDASQWDDSGVANKTVKLTDAWQRVALSFDPAFMATLNQLRLTVNGSAWIDAMQVLPGEDAGEYAPRLPYEVALAFPKSDASVGRVQFDDEPATLDYAVTGQGTEAPVLKAKVVDIHGQETPLAPVKLAGGFMNKGQLSFRPAGDRTLGCFRVEAWVEDGSGARIGSANEAVVTRVRRPRHWGEDAPRSPFGTHSNSLLRHITLAKSIGMNWTRLHDAGTQYIGWSFLEPEKGKWTFFDEDIQRYRKGDLRILGMLSTAPGWASSVGRPATGYFDRWVRPLDNAQFGHYVDTVVTRYKGVIDDWEIWNEPWGKFWSDWDSAKKDNVIPADASKSYAELSKVAYASAKKASPESTIGGINTYGSLAKNWTGDLLRYGATEACDVYTYHQYNAAATGFPGDAVERDYKNSWQPILDAHGGKSDKPIWFSEGNAVDHLGGRGMYVLSAPGAFQDDYIEVSDRLARFSVRLLSLGVDRFFYYTMHHHGIFRSGPSAWMACITDDGAPHPSAAAFSAMAWELEDTRFVKTIEVAEGVYAHLFEGEGRSVAALTSARKWGRYAMPQEAGLTLHDLFGNPLPAGSSFEGRVVYIGREGSVAELEGRVRQK